ncbi:rho GTPase-activating protein 11A-like isoform X2 [Protopterus annectens]|uniref:rho GTPase-activating protein 11A-like isoform X2 n=1 Tax=Protopterus annectens TaxID=7888 RepID=UPI001CFBC324|nr:rho GTPase-activating protein 11A-like isoform X2 [Protopterus annectens]
MLKFMLNKMVQSSEKNVIRLAVVQHLRQYGIKIKNWNSKQSSYNSSKHSCHGHKDSGRLFGAPLHSLPHSLVSEFGNIPSFLSDACRSLEQHLHTEGLFRKSGSVLRLKALKAKLEEGGRCIQTALPCDVAGLLKQFFRELPEPVIPMDLQEALFKAQELGKEEKISATLLISCLLTEKTTDILRYFFKFLKNVSLRSEDNKMDSSNLAVIFAPNLMHSAEYNEKITVGTEKKLRLQASVIQTFIDHADSIGVVPEFILEKIPAMLGVEPGCLTPSVESLEEAECESPKRQKRRSVGGTPLILTPSTKRKLAGDSTQGFSTKKLRSLKQNLAVELLPSTFFSTGSTPCLTQYQGCGRLSESNLCVSSESYQNSFSPCASSSRHKLGSANPRRSKRLENKKIHRVESGKTGCFSPKINRKELVRKSLRLRFSIGKTGRESNILSGFPASNGSENIGWRLANQQESESSTKILKEDQGFSPIMKEMTVKQGSGYPSKSQDNSFTPKNDDSLVQWMSWNEASNSESQEINNSLNAATPLGIYLKSKKCFSKPVLAAGKPPIIPVDYENLEVTTPRDSLSGDENSLAVETLDKIKKAFSETGSNLCTLIGDSKSSNLLEAHVENSHVVEEFKMHQSESSFCKKAFDEDGTSSVIEKQMEMLKCCDKHDHIFKSSESLVQNSITELSSSLLNDLTESQILPERALLSSPVKEQLLHLSNAAEQFVNSQECYWSLRGTNEVQSSVQTAEDNQLCSIVVSAEETLHTSSGQSCNALEYIKIQKDTKAHLPEAVETVNHHRGKVAEHIQRFNRLSLGDSDSSKKIKSPLKFQRTPVRQSVRRINSLLGCNRQVEFQNASIRLPIRRIHSFLDSNTQVMRTGMKCEETFPTTSLVKSGIYESASSCAKRYLSNSAYSLMQSNDTQDDESFPLKHCHSSKKTCIPELISSSAGTPESLKIVKQMNLTVLPKASILEDLTNQKESKIIARYSGSFKNKSTIRTPQKTPNKFTFNQFSDKEKSRYRGSPKYPIPSNRLVTTSNSIAL